MTKNPFTETSWSYEFWNRGYYSEDPTNPYDKTNSARQIYDNGHQAKLNDLKDLKILVGVQSKMVTNTKLDFQQAMLFYYYAKSLKDSKGKRIAAGLAANQVGYDIRLCVVLTDTVEHLALNPIIRVSGRLYDSEEGCLSWPGKLVLAKRHEKINVKFYDVLKGEEVEKDVSGWEAKIWLHENDHLDGITENVVDKDYKTFKNPDKIGRNDSCSCGSGKKYKKCCGGNK